MLGVILVLLVAMTIQIHVWRTEYVSSIALVKGTERNCIVVV
jgi:hypothetical protein